MSVKALTCAMALRDVSPSEKLLLLALANYADENMRCYPSQRRLAEDTCLTERTIRSLLAALETRLIISREERQRQDNSRATDLVTLHFYGEVRGVPETVSGGAEIISGGYRKPVPGVPETASALTTFEPSLEPEEADASSSRDAFATFWSAYPNKVCKRDAKASHQRALRRISGPDPPGVILAGVQRAKGSRRWREGYIPNPATWLNQDRWEDELDDTLKPEAPSAFSKWMQARGRA